MAPQKTMVVSQPQSGFVDQSSNNQVAIVTAKPRKRKSKQQQPQQQQLHPQPKASVELVEQRPKLTTTNTQDSRSDKNFDHVAKQEELLIKSDITNINSKHEQQNQQQQQQQQQPLTKSAAKTTAQNNKQQQNRQQEQPQTVVACERSSIVAKQQQQKSENKVPTTVPKQQVQSSINKTRIQQQQSIGDQKRQAAGPGQVQQSSGPLQPASLIGKQLSVEDTDDIDAGIELDGSSNSGSSVKDINEDSQTNKSASVSPIMTQSNLVTNNSQSAAKHAMEVAPVEQLTGSLCTEMTPKSKKAAATKQQLAADQLVIDADEEQLQQKLISKQRRQNQDSSATTAPSVCTTSTTRKDSIKTKSSLPSLSMPNSSTPNGASNDSQVNTPQSPAMCKVCEQHVYQMERMLAEKSVYHKKCFRCQQCNIQLRVDNYSSHEGQLYCKVHHRQLLQPQAKLNSEDDVDIVAKSTYKQVDNYLLQRGRLSEFSLSFLNQTTEGLRQRQMIICENEPAELPKDVVRSDTKVDDGFEQLNLNLKDIAQRFERGTANSSGDDSQPQSAGVVVEKPSVSIKKTLLAFESRGSGDASFNDESKRVTERPVVRKLTNLSSFLERQSSQDGNDSTSVPTNKPLSVRRSESLMLRLKKYESRIAGEQVNDDDDGDGNADAVNDNDDENNNRDGTTNSKKKSGDNQVPKKLTSIDLSSLKNQWENGDISRRRQLDDDFEPTNSSNDATGGEASGGIDCNGNSPQYEKSEELHRIRQQLACKKLGGESGNVRNIYENAIKEREQLQKQEAKRNQTSDLPTALNRFSTTEIQKQLLQQNGSQNDSHHVKTQLPNKDHFQLNLSKKANKLKEKFELGLINNDSRDDSDQSDCEDGPVMSKLEQLRQEKMEDLSIFTEGEIGAREARNMFQQIDRRLSAGATNGKAITKSNNKGSQVSSFRSTLRSQQSQESQVKPKAPTANTTSNTITTATTTSATINSQDRLQRHINNINDNLANEQQPPSTSAPENQPIRLTNNVRM